MDHVAFDGRRSRRRERVPVPGLAHVARVSLAETERAIQAFLAPDGYSRTPDHDGRRIAVCDGGWRLLNYEKYRAPRDTDQRREDNAHYKRAERERNRQSGSVSSGEQSSAPVSNVSTGQPLSAQAEAEAEAEEKTSILSTWADVAPKPPVTAAQQTPAISTIESSAPLELAPQARRKKKASFTKACLQDIYDAYPKHVDADAALKAIEKALHRLIEDGHAGERYDYQEAYVSLLSATSRYASSALVKRKRAAGEMQFIPAPAAWFNKGGYKSDPKEWA